MSIEGNPDAFSVKQHAKNCKSMNARYGQRSKLAWRHICVVERSGGQIHLIEQEIIDALRRVERSEIRRMNTNPLKSPSIE